MLIKNFLICLLLVAAIFSLPNQAFALYQPWKAEQEARQIYQGKLKTYSSENQQKIESLAKLIEEVNARDTGELKRVITAQGDILEEYRKRQGYPEEDAKIEKAQYWLTYAHEAVAFQEAKNYIFNLTSQNNIKADVSPTVGQLKADLTATRKKVLNSLGTIQGVIK